MYGNFMKSKNNLHIDMTSDFVLENNSNISNPSSRTKNLSEE